MAEPTASAPDAPSTAGELFGVRLPVAQAFARALAGTGVSHGLIGPREVTRLWDRHLLNCAVVQEIIPQAATVIDVGSGAGLPGVPLAIARPDLDIHLVEPMLRRTTWLTSVLADLGLDNVQVHRGRAQELGGTLTAEVVTARAVARIGELASWCLPLVRSRGRLLALKGASAAHELAAEERVLRRLGYGEAEVRTCGVGIVDPPTTVIALTRVAMDRAAMDRAAVDRAAMGAPRRLRSDEVLARRRGRQPNQRGRGDRGPLTGG